VPATLGFLATITNYSPFTSTIHLVGPANYMAVLQDPQFAAAARNIMLFTVAAVPLELIVGFAIAYLLRAPLRGRSALRVLMLLPWLISPIGSGVMWHFLLGQTHGLVDYGLEWIGFHDVTSPLGDVRFALAAVVAIEVWRLAPFVAFLVLPGLLVVPQERWDYAALAGASWLRTIQHVAVPSVGPLLLTIAMLLMGLALGSFDVVLILTGGGPGTATLTPALYSYSGAFESNDWPVAATAAWLIAGAVLSIGVVYLRASRERQEG
jgi:multiple sugar transport system permease protein